MGEDQGTAKQVKTLFAAGALSACLVASCQADEHTAGFVKLPRPSTTTTTTTIVVPTTTTSTLPPTTTTTEVPTPLPEHEPVPAAPCAAALVGLNAVGLPSSFTFYCDATYARGNNGVTVWDVDSQTGYVAIDPAGGDYAGIGAHEACHAQGLAVGDDATEADAFACAAAHGYPEPYE